jgi:drug/metabolite transporter (DMT)-like permease
MSPFASRRAKLALAFAIVYLVWGSTYMVASIGVHIMPPILFGGVRFICAGILLGLVSIAMGSKYELDAAEWKRLLIVAVGSVFIPNACTNWAMQYIASNQTAILNATAALWIALFATQGRRAHALDRRTALGLIIGFAGTVLIVWPRDGARVDHLGYQLLILLIVLIWSATTVYIRNAHSKLDLLPFSSLQMLLGGIMMTGLGLGMGEASQWTWSKPGLLAMAYLTVASSCVAYTAFSWLARNTTPAMVGTYSYVNPAIAAVLGWWFLDEHLGTHQVTGMAVMFAGVALVSWPQREARREEKRLDADEQKDPSTAG